MKATSKALPFPIHHLPNHAERYGRRPHHRAAGNSSPLPVHVGLPTDSQVEATVLELAVLLAQRQVLAAAVHQEVRALPFIHVVLGPQLGPVEARVQAPHPRRGADEPIDESTRETWAGAFVHDVSDLPERDAGAQACDETVSRVVHAVEKAGGPFPQPAAGA